ncbi:MAG: hypothetical protein E4G95_01240 [Bacteroidia bacterium]|nr:MAG: hypothetical protein E4G95_01240 [Bacteroidia bacterium]
MNRYTSILLVSLLVGFSSSCKKEKEVFTSYIDLELLADWQDFEIAPDEEIIMRIAITTESKVDIAWKDALAMKEGDGYTADILVSAYRPDGVTPYFEDLDNGYQENSQLPEIVDGDTQLLLVIKPKDGQGGTFTIRARGVNDNVVTNPIDLPLGSDYVDKNIAAGEIKWLKVDCGTVTDLVAEWMEFDRPAVGSNYTADIIVSIYSEDLSVVYLENQNHGYDANARKFTLTHGTHVIYIKISQPVPEVPGTYAIRVYEQVK